MSLQIFKPKSPRAHHPPSPASQTPISVLHVTLQGAHERITSTCDTTAPPVSFGNSRYHLPRFLENNSATSPIRRIAFEFTEADTSMGAAGAQEAFLGVYCIWYREGARPRSVGEYEGFEGEFWIMRQGQWRLGDGEVVVWEDVPVGMEDGMEGEWWFKGSVLPVVRRLMMGGGVRGKL